MTYAQILNDLKNKVYHPVYFLMGEEPYFIDSIADFIEKNVLSEAECEFNLSVLYGIDIATDALIARSRRYPMMANHQVVIVREAQMMKDIDNLLPYIEKPVRTTILVLCYKYKELDKRTRFAKQVAEHGVLYNAKKLYDNEVVRWISSFLSDKKYKISSKAEWMLTEYLGADLSKIAGELDKLTINISPAEQITEDHIERFIGISKDFNNFELNNALAVKNAEKANRIISYFAANPKSNPMVLTLFTLFSFFSKVLCYHYIKDKEPRNVSSLLKISPFFLKDYQTAAKNYSIEKLKNIASLLREYDLKSKGMNNISTPDGELLRELVFKIIH